MLVGAFFLRSSALPTGLSSQHLFLACSASLVVTFAYLLSSRRVTVSNVALGFTLLTLPSLMAAEDMSTATVRWAGWFLVIAAVGPLFSDEIRLKLKVLDWTRTVLLICAIGSLMLNLAGIRLSGRGLFYGLMGHTMILAPVCALAAIDLFCRNKESRSRWHTILLVMCCLTCIGAGSRGAVLGMTFGILTHVAHRREGFMVIVLAAAALIAVGYAQADDDDKAVGVDLSEGVYSELTSKGTNDTRGHLWAARIEEFVSSPAIGVGFQQQRVYRKDTEEKFLEPGSSYLAVLSMTGLSGALGFAMLATNVFFSLYTSNSAVPKEYKDLLRGWVAFFSIHLIIEGYIFACGSLLCFLFWLTVGCTMSLQHQGRRLQLRNRILQRTRLQSRARRQAA